MSDDYHDDGTPCHVAVLLSLIGPAEIFPRGDLDDHTQGRGCRCGPEETDDGFLLVHTSFDGREYAQGSFDTEH